MNIKLVGVALLFSILAMISSFVAPDGMNSVNEKPDFVSVIELANKIKNRESFRLIDLRNKDKFEEFHLPTAENISINSVLDMDFFGLVIFYSGDDNLSRELWEDMSDDLKSDSQILFGGVHDWYEKLLYPEVPIKASREYQQLVDEINELSSFYGGQSELVQDEEILKYYRIDFNKAYWPKSHRENGLVRKGC